MPVARWDNRLPEPSARSPLQDVRSRSERQKPEDVPLHSTMAAILLRRTPEQVADSVLSWDRPDRSFFAAGACHMLAHRMATRHGGLDIVHMRPIDNLAGSHVYALDGARAFDFNGWTNEADLVAANTEACRAENPAWDFDRIVIEGDFDEYCRSVNHRTADQYPGDVLARADLYIESLLA